MPEQPVSRQQQIDNLKKQLKDLRGSLTTVKSDTRIYERNSEKITECENDLKALDELEYQSRIMTQIPIDIVDLVKEVTEYIQFNAWRINENDDLAELNRQIYNFRQLREKINDVIRRCEDRGENEDGSYFKKYRALKEQLYEIISNLDLIITKKSEAGRVSQDNQSGRKGHQGGRKGSL